MSSQDFLWVELPPAKNQEFHVLTGVKASLRPVLNGFRLLAGQLLVQRISLRQVLGEKTQNNKAQRQGVK